MDCSSFAGACRSSDGSRSRRSVSAAMYGMLERRMKWTFGRYIFFHRDAFHLANVGLDRALLQSKSHISRPRLSRRRLLFFYSTGFLGLCLVSASPSSSLAAWCGPTGSRRPLHPSPVAPQFHSSGTKNKRATVLTKLRSLDGTASSSKLTSGLV